MLDRQEKKVVKNVAIGVLGTWFFFVFVYPLLMFGIAALILHYGGSGKDFSRNMDPKWHSPGSCMAQPELCDKKE
jgi:hypothetical protein